MSSKGPQRQDGSSLVLPGDVRSPGQRPVRVLVHLSGPRRGSTQRLDGDGLRLGTAVQAEVRVSPEPMVAAHHATLRRQADGGYEILAEPDCPLWVNGDSVHRRTLAAGDVLEIGRDGPLLRYRVYPPGTRASKSVAEAFADGVDAARFGSRSQPARAALGAAGAIREMAVRGPLWLRLTATVVLAALVISSVMLLRRSVRLEARLAVEARRVEGLSALLDRMEPGLSGAEVATMRRELLAALERVESLEARSGATARVVATAAPAVALLLGSYGFVDPATGEPLRFLGLDDDGRPLRDRTGEPIVGLGGSGPPVEVYLTGTAFLGDGSGLLVSNRHLAEPWRYDAAAQRAMTHGLEPSVRRFIAYLPGLPEAFAARPLLVSETADLALLLAPGLAGLAPPLALRSSPPAAGEEVIVLGYPAGIRAMLARADARFMNSLLDGGRLGFWQMAERLARSGQIGPLASRGIVAQVSPTAVVYDAETTQGGSGGPVLDLDGRVVAVTSAVVTEFGGSNLGVPAGDAALLLAQQAMSGPLTAWHR